MGVGPQDHVQQSPASVVRKLMPQLKADLAQLVAVPCISAPGFPEATRPALLEAYEMVVGLFRDGSLGPGTYWLEETRALPGFELLAERVEFTISETGAVSLADGTAPNARVVEIDGVPTIRVEDVAAMRLPTTGGPGATPFVLAGILLLAVAAALVGRQRRRAPRP